MKVLIGIDDTDNKESRGTGYNSRQLGKEITVNNLGFVEGITRHQLFVHPDIPYTSQNSSACLVVETENFEGLKLLCREFMLKNEVPGCDIGLCLLEFDNVNEEIINWGRMAKNTVLKQKGAYELAERHNFYLEGLAGTKDGVIGALAGIGLRKWGHDGRFIWLLGKEIRDLKGTMSVEEITGSTGVFSIETIDGIKAEPQDLVFLGDWVRPIIRNNNAVIIIEKYESGKCKWKCVEKSVVKSISD